MDQVYRFCGLGVAFIERQMPPEQRKKAYTADVTYCAKKEVTADFLRDRLVLGKSRGLSSALAAKITGAGKSLSATFEKLKAELSLSETSQDVRLVAIGQTP